MWFPQYLEKGHSQAGCRSLTQNESGRQVHAVMIAFEAIYHSHGRVAVKSRDLSSCSGKLVSGMCTDLFHTHNARYKHS